MAIVVTLFGNVHPKETQSHTMRTPLSSSYFLKSNISSPHALNSLQAAKMIVLKDLRSAKTALAELATVNCIFHSQKKDAHDVVMKHQVKRVGWQSVSDSTAIPKVLEQFYPTLCN